MAKAELTDYERLANWMIKSEESVGEVAEVLFIAYPDRNQLRETYKDIFKRLKKVPWPWGYLEE